MLFRTVAPFSMVEVYRGFQCPCCVMMEVYTRGDVMPPDHTLTSIL